MEFARLGNTGLTVSRICLGCMSYGDPNVTAPDGSRRWPWVLNESDALPFFKRALEAGIQPHIIACRASRPVQPKVMQKIAMFSNVIPRRVFSLHDRESIYTIPDEMRQEGLDREIMSILHLHDRVDLSHEDRSRERWMAYVRRMQSPKQRVAARTVLRNMIYGAVDKTAR